MTRRWSSGAGPRRPAAAAPGEDSNGTNGEYCSGTDTTVCGCGGRGVRPERRHQAAKCFQSEA
jgi:hypothetical protein